MAPFDLRHQLEEEIDHLAPEQQQRLLEVARSMIQKKELPQGTPWSELKHLAGILPDEDAAEIMAAIEEGCENIDYEGW
jgi:hypothetical protein